MRTLSDHEPASFLQRAAAYAIDLIAVGFIWFGSAVVAGIPGSRPEEGLDEPWGTIVEIIIVALPAYWFVYHWIANAIGVSVGKRMMSISIEPVITAPAPILRGLVRTIGEVISALPLGLGYFWALWDPENRTWHDKMAGTRVINGRPARLPRPAGIERERPSPRPPAKNLRFACAPSSPAAGVRYVELRREGFRFEDQHGLRGFRYQDVEGATALTSGDVEIRFQGHDVFDRPTEQTIRLAVSDREEFLAELETRVGAARGEPLTVVR